MYRLSDPYHIEKSVFKRHENQYPKLLRKVTRPAVSSVTVSKSDLTLFFEILVTIQKRNPTYRQKIIEAYIEHVTSDEFRKEAQVGIEIARTIDTTDPVAYFENYVKEAAIDKNKQSDMYLSSFLDKENKNTETVVQTLLQYKLYVYHAPLGSQFITSDSPGFTLLPNGDLLRFGGLGLNFKFLFPLTPTCCLFITYRDLDKDSKLSLTKTIEIIRADVAAVDLVNEATFQLSMERVFAYGKEILNGFRKVGN